MNTISFENPKKIKKVCEWTGKIFYVDWKHRNQRFIDKNAMYEWRKSQSREIVKCLKCGESFERYRRILHPKTGKPTQYCSNECNKTSQEKIDKLKKWALSDKNHWNNPECQEKVKQTKLRLYGEPYYSNKEKQQNTMMDKYGVACAFFLPKCKTNGKRISNFQKKVYIEIKQKHSDALLETYLKDVRKSVDIFIPSKKKVIECYGDYWHCNPNKCKPDYYNRLVHLTAKEIWDRDEKRVEMLKQNGYDVEIIWENTNKNFIHSTKL